MPRTTRNRTLIAQARVSEAELAKWRAKAAAAGVGLSELLRRAMARTRTWTAAAAKVERERTRELARIGSNLNQIARWARHELRWLDEEIQQARNKDKEFEAQLEA